MALGGGGGHDVSSTQAVAVHSINNCVVLGKYQAGEGGAAVVARADGLLRGTLRSTC